MAMGWFALVSLLAAAPAGQPEVWHMNQTRFTIPITFNPERRADIRELVLYVSRDQGKSWDVAGRAKPDQDRFSYFAPADGPYWFRIAIINTKGVSEPRDIYTAEATQRIVVDTQKPEVHVAPERQGEEILVRWEVKEDNPDPGTLKLEYRGADSPSNPWTAVMVQPALAGQVTFRPGLSGPVTVRMQMADQAGNLGAGQADVQAAVGTPQPALPTAALQTASTNPPAPAPSGSGYTPPLNPPALNPPALTPAPAAPLPANAGPSNPTTVAVSKPPYVLAGASEPMTPTARDPLPPPVPPPSGGPGLNSLPPGAAPPSGMDTATVGLAATPPPLAPGSLKAESQALQIVNKRLVKLEFQVAKFGPSGLGSVEVYVTQDDGSTWEKMPSNLKVNWPRPEDIRPGVPVQAEVEIPLAKEATPYGFYLVVKSRAGLGKPAPRPGDLPQIRVELDTTSPEAFLYNPEPDPSRRDTLVLRWKATDRNLAGNPVSLEWAEQPGGPWQHIGPEQMANTGQFVWQVPANVPPSVFLRLSVRDTAGNVAKAETDKPILVDLNVPDVSIIGLSGAGK